MAVTAADIKFYKAITETDTIANGGRKGHIQLVSNTRNFLFPRVTRQQRIDGIIRYRKTFHTNMNANDETAYEVSPHLLHPTNGGDRVYFCQGTMTDTQADITADPQPIWTGCGKLHTALVGGETSVTLEMKANDYRFLPASPLYLSSKYMVSQTINTGINPGDSVQWNSTTSRWEKITATDDYAYPKGVYLSGNKVLTFHATAKEDWLTLAEKKYTDEVIGTGNGSSTSPTLSTLAHITNGLLVARGYVPTITVTCGGTARTVTISATGACAGYCSAGQINLATGTWTIPITWTTAPDNSTQIKITYYDKNYTYSGNNVTLYLETGKQVSQTFSTDNTWGSGTFQMSTDEKASVGTVSVSSTNGTYNSTLFPPYTYNDGTEEDIITLTFTSGSAFTASGLYEGSLGTGVVGSDFSPTNPNTGQPYLTIYKNGWGGTFLAGDTVSIPTHPAACGIWLKKIVPAGTDQEPNNLIAFEVYSA